MRVSTCAAGAILIEEVGLRRYRSRDVVLLGCWSLLEIFWYYPLTAAWRTWATLLVAAGRHRLVDDPARRALGRAPDAAAAPLPR